MNIYNRLDYVCKGTGFQRSAHKKRTISEETVPYFDVGQKNF